MDTKVTLHFDKEVIEKAKLFAAKNNVSLSRLTEFLYKKLTAAPYESLEDFPISDWVNEVAEGKAVYKRRSRKELKDHFLKSKK